MKLLKDFFRNKKLFSSPKQLHLEPVLPIDVQQCTTAQHIVQAMKHTAFGGRKVGEAHDVLYDMFSDKTSFNVLTLSGAMTVAKMSLLFCELIERGFIHAIASTGALITHGLVENVSLTHYKHTGKYSDKELYKMGFNRIYDTLEPEKNLDDVEKLVAQLLDQWNPNEPLCSWKLLNHIGAHLSKNTTGKGILKSAYEHNVPIYIPAFTDCELGLDVGLYRRKQKAQGKKEIIFDPFIDLDDFASRIKQQKTLGIFTIGGGVPRNWAQQVGPYLDVMHYTLPKEGAHVKYKYGVRICPEPAQWGGLSGCTYSESVSWGKFIPPEAGGRWAEIPADATIVLPLLIRSVIERFETKTPTLQSPSQVGLLTQ